MVPKMMSELKLNTGTTVPRFFSSSRFSLIRIILHFINRFIPKVTWLKEGFILNLKKGLWKKGGKNKKWVINLVIKNIY